MIDKRSFFAALTDSNPSMIYAADILLQLTSEAGTVWAEAKHPHRITIQTGSGEMSSYHVPNSISWFRMVLARIATICEHAPTLEWKGIPVGQLSPSFLQLHTYLINVNDNDPKYFRVAMDKNRSGIYGCAAVIAVCTPDGVESFIEVQTVNTTDQQSFRGQAVVAPTTET